jgi:hypothetical protein
MMDPYGKVFCAKDGGGAMREQYGTVVCGIGYCAADDTGRISRTAHATHRATNGPASSGPPRSAAFKRSYTAGKVASHSISGLRAASYRWSKEHD